MVTAEKTARTMLKQANELGNTLREIVRRDLADETRRFNDTLNQRIQTCSEAIVQAVKQRKPSPQVHPPSTVNWRKHTDGIRRTTIWKSFGAYYSPRLLKFNNYESSTRQLLSL